MWITTVTYDLDVLRAMDEAERINIMVSVMQKKNELKETDGAGTAAADYPEPTDFSGLLSGSEPSFVIKRIWNQETAAKLFADHFDGITGITATLEEQV